MSAKGLNRKGRKERKGLIWFKGSFFDMELVNPQKSLCVLCASFHLNSDDIGPFAIDGHLDIEQAASGEPPRQSDIALIEPDIVR